jgi:hypothetical protein
MKFTALKHRVLAAQAQFAPAGTTIRVKGGPPAPPCEPQGSPPVRENAKVSSPNPSVEPS